MSRKNLLIQTAFIGDLLLSIPLARRLRENYPEHELHLLCRHGQGEIFLLTGLVDKIIEVNKSQKKSWKKARLEVLSNEYNLVISPHESLTTAQLVFQIKAQRKIGFQHWWNFIFYDERIKRPMIFPESIRQLSLLSSIDTSIKDSLYSYGRNFSIENSFSLDELPKEQDSQYVPLWASMSLREFFSDLEDSFVNNRLLAHKEKLSIYSRNVLKMFSEFHIDRERPILFMAPGSVWGTKRWTIKGYAEVGNEMSRRGYQVIITGAPVEEEICSELSSLVPGSVNLVNKCNLFESVLLYIHGSLMVTNDCGAMHLAAVAELPTVSIFGPTVLRFGYRPWQNRALVVQNKELSCRPCGKHGPQKCPLGTHECMTSISSQKVIKAVQKIIGNKNS